MVVMVICKFACYYSNSLSHDHQHAIVDRMQSRCLLIYYKGLIFDHTYSTHFSCLFFSCLLFFPFKIYSTLFFNIILSLKYQFDTCILIFIPHMHSNLFNNIHIATHIRYIHNIHICKHKHTCTCTHNTHTMSTCVHIYHARVCSHENTYIHMLICI